MTREPAGKALYQTFTQRAISTEDSDVFREEGGLCRSTFLQQLIVAKILPPNTVLKHNHKFSLGKKSPVEKDSGSLRSLGFSNL